MSSEVITFPVYSFRKLPTPFDELGFEKFFSMVRVSDLPDLSNWRKINVRDPKTRGAVPKAIRDGFHDYAELFTFMNRGLVISARGVKFDNKTQRVSVALSNHLTHGLLDGGHSYNIVMEEIQGMKGEDRYVQVEFLTGFQADDTLNVVDARNTSNQVADESLMNLQGAFGPLKDAIKDEPYANLIAWKEYEIDADGNPKPVDVREIIAVLMAFDQIGYGSQKHPINSYRSKAAALKFFKENTSNFDLLYPFADQFLRLYDEIYLNLPTLYNEARKSSADEVSGGKFGRLTGVSVKSGKSSVPLYFIGNQSTYGIPAGFIYPILGAFRALMRLDKKTGSYKWIENIDPVEALNDGLGLSLAEYLGNFALEMQNPSKLGKSINVWQSLYDRARVYLMDQVLV